MENSPFIRDRPWLCWRQLCAVTVALLCWGANASQGTVYYVRVGGNDNADGLTPETSLATVGQAGMRLANPGDQVIVGPGTYAEGNIGPARSGIPGHPMQFLADVEGIDTGDLPGPVVIMPPNDGVQTTGFLLLGKHDVVIDGFTIVGAVDAGIQVRSAPDGSANSSEVTIRNTLVRSSAKRGIDISATGSIVVENDTAENNGSGGIVIQGCLSPSPLCRADTSSPVVPVVSQNTVTMNGAEGISVSGATGATIVDNSVQDSGAAGIAVRGSSQVSALRNCVARSNGSGIQVGVSGETVGQDLSVEDNQVTGSAAAGINAFMAGAVEVRGNAVTHSGSSGLSVQSGGSSMTLTASNNTIGMSGADGIFVAGCDTGIVQNNVVFSNGDTGITLRGAANTMLVNNLVYANSSDGLAVGTADMAAPNATILNNTVYGNGGWGLRVGTSTVASTDGTVIDNIFQLNSGGGIAIATSSTCGYVAGFNINVDGYGPHTPQSPYDIAAAPLLLDPAGPDGVLGGTGFLDDDFHLRQVLGGQSRNSPGVDAGFAAVADVGLSGGTAAGMVHDFGRIDIGYHYGASASQHIALPTLWMPIFVRLGGDDGKDGMDPQHALATIQEAAQRAQAGGTVVVAPGRYFEGDIHPKQNGGQTAFFADSSGTMTGDVPGVVLVDATGKDTGFVVLASCNAVVDGFHVTGAMSAGIQVRSGAVNAQIRNNTSFSNLDRGIEILEVDQGQISNNLAYANGTGGIRVSSSSNSTVVNNTVYGNGQVGIFVGGPADVEAAPGTSVLRNLVAHNGKGIKVETNSFAGYVSGFNVSLDGFEGNTPRADSDFVADPLFVLPAGLDGVLGGTGFADDDFHLVQDGGALSPGVDIDFDEVNSLAWGSTRSDGLPDIGPLDAGYHYPFLPRVPLPPSIGGVVFVRANGDDGNSGVSPEAALATIGAAVKNIVGGGLIVVGPGTYHERGIRLGTADGGTGPTALVGDGPGALTGDASGSVVIDAGGGAGPVVAGPILIDGITFTGARGPGVWILRTAHDVTLRNSVVCGNTGGGIATAADGVRAVNNLICNNGGIAINMRLVHARRSSALLNNTVVSNSGAGIIVRELSADASPSHVLLYNNIVSGNGGRGITVRTVRRLAPLMGNNLNTDGYGPGTQPGPSDITAAPLFIGASGLTQSSAQCTNADDFRLLPNSPAIDAGVSTAVGLGLGGRSATSDGMPDVGPTDLGFHG